MKVHDSARGIALNLLASGPMGVEDIKKEIVDNKPAYRRLARARTAAGRSRLDAAVWGIMSSLCNSGLAESTGAQRFRITERGKKTIRRGDQIITAAQLMGASEDYRSLATDPDPAAAAPPPKAAKVDPKYGAVGMLDMLGTRRPRSAGRTSGVHRNWNGFMSRSCHAVANGRGLEAFRISAFSDTMFITAEGDARDLLGAFGRLCTYLVPLSIEMDVPIRGCVAAGRFYESGRVLFTGPAVSEAAAYHGMPQWVGVSCCPSAYSVLDGATDGGRGSYTKYDIPLKASVEYGGLAVNWPDRYNHEHADREKDLNGMLRRLERRMETAPDIDASLKWRNTRDFLRAKTGTEGRLAGARQRKTP